MNILKRIGVFVLLFTIVTVVSFKAVEVNADLNNINMVEGASIRTTGVQGLKFSATFDETAISSLGETDTRGFFIMYGEATVSDLVADEPNHTALVNGKSIKQESDYNKTSNIISVVLTGIPTTGYSQQITVVAFTKIDGVFTYTPTEVERSVAEVALSAAKAGQSASVSTVLSAMDSNYLKATHDEFDNFVISPALFEYDRVSLRSEFIEDWNAFNGTTWTNLDATTFYNSAKTGILLSTDISGSNIYNFFNDADMNTKWGWILTFIQNNDGTTHASRQAVAVEGDGTNGTYSLYNTNHLSYSIANFFNKAHESGGYSSIDFSNALGLAKYDNVPTYNFGIYAEYSNYSYVQLGESIILANVPARDYYIGTGYLDGSTPVSSGPGYIVTGTKNLESQYTPLVYSVIYYDGVTELSSLNSTYTVESEKVLDTYEKDGFIFDGWYEDSGFTGSVITVIPEGSNGTKIYYAKTTESSNVTVEVTYDLNEGQLNSTDLYTLRTSDVKLTATRYQNTTSWINGTEITVNTLTRSSYYVIAVQETGVSGIFEVIGKGVAYSNVNADLYIMMHDACTSIDKATFTAQYNTVAVGSLVVMEFVPTVQASGYTIDIYFIDSNEATADVVVNMLESGPTLMPVRAGYTFLGWCEESDLSDTPILTYPGFTAGDAVTAITYYASWSIIAD